MPRTPRLIAWLLLGCISESVLAPRVQDVSRSSRLPVPTGCPQAPNLTPHPLALSDLWCVLEQPQHLCVPPPSPFPVQLLPE